VATALADASTTIRQLVLSHLSEDELALHHDDALEPIQRQLVQAHLDRCLLCSRRQEYTAEPLATAWDEEGPAEEQEPPAPSSQETPDPTAVVQRLIMQFVVPALLQQMASRARAADQDDFEMWEDPEGGLRGSVERQAGEALVCFDSTSSELDGKEVPLEIGGICKVLRFERLEGERQVYAETRFSFDECRKLAGDDRYTVGKLQSDE
jgi:hypothetical protein